jgi:hypothetical protein
MKNMKKLFFFALFLTIGLSAEAQKWTFGVDGAIIQEKHYTIFFPDQTYPVTNIQGSLQIHRNFEKAPFSIGFFSTMHYYREIFDLYQNGRSSFPDSYQQYFVGPQLTYRFGKGSISESKYLVSYRYAREIGLNMLPDIKRRTFTEGTGNLQAIEVTRLLRLGSKSRAGLTLFYEQRNYFQKIPVLRDNVIETNYNPKTQNNAGLRLQFFLMPK